MGIDYKAIIAIGLTFEQWEAEEFLVKHGIATEEEIEEAGGLDEYLDGSDKIGGECLNCYSGDYYYIGYAISTSDPESFRESFENGMKMWKELLPNIEPDVIKTVKVY